MKLSIFVVDAFGRGSFSGNPAAVVPLKSFLPDQQMQAIAAQHNLAETAFLVPGSEPELWHLRWFTPEVEIALCGHATLASGAIVLDRLAPGLKLARFQTLKAGELTVTRDPGAGGWRLDLPAIPVSLAEPPPGLERAIGARIRTTARAGSWLVEVDDWSLVAGLDPDLDEVEDLTPDGLIVTATGAGLDDGQGRADFVSRFFAPGQGVPEDPVTGSAHSRLVPFWAARLGRTDLNARQLSSRGGWLACKLADGRVEMAGEARVYLEGTIHLV